MLYSEQVENEDMFTFCEIEKAWLLEYYLRYFIKSPFIIMSLILMINKVTCGFMFIDISTVWPRT
jgi:hypothetical protein